MKHTVRRDSDLSYVKAFAERAPQEIWAAGEGGLVLIDKGNIRPIKPAANDSLKDVSGIVDAGIDGIWLNTSGGVIHISRDEMERTLREPSYRFQSERFEAPDGLPGPADSIYPFPKAVQGTDGRIWFTATRGVAWVDPKNIPKNVIPPPISITSVSADGSEYRQLADLQLPAHTANIQINYSALSLAVPERVHFRYKLDGVDRDWQDVRSRRQAFYSGLRPGTYRFRVTACNDSGLWNETGGQLGFSVGAAWFQTRLFQISCVTVFFLLLWALYRLRIRSIELRSKQLASINAELKAQIEGNAVLFADLQLQVALLQEFPVAAWTLKPDGTPDFVNRVWLEFSGQTLAFVRSHAEAWMTAVHPQDRESASKIFWEGVQSGRDFAMETRSLRAQDGTYRWHLQRAVALRDADGKVLKFVGTTTDIDDQKRAQEALRQAQADLAHITRVTTMGELAASIAHEVNQPIAGVMINANACLRWLSGVREDSANLREARAAVERIIRDDRRAGEIIARIKALFKKTELAREPLDLNETIREIIVLARSDMDKQRVALRLALSPDLPKVVGDRVQLQQVMLNLILNAIDAMASVQGRTRDLIIETRSCDPKEVVVAVRDTGIGLNSESVEHIFTAFHTTKPGGLGMGLSISRSIVENHGGRLWGAANEGPGASFQFTLPRNPSDDQPGALP